MKDAQKPDHVSLNTLVARLEEGRFVVPDFQTEFEWRPWDIGELMRSVFLDYYIGSLLLWKGTAESFAALSCEPVYGYKGNGNPEHIVLDGQQRLTAMLYAFLSPDVPLPNRTRRAFCFIKVDHFMAEDYDQAFGYDWYTKRWAETLNKREAQFASHLFPLSIIGAGGWDLANWVQDYEQFWKVKAAESYASGDAETFKQTSIHATNAREFGKHLKGITEQHGLRVSTFSRPGVSDFIVEGATKSRPVRLICSESPRISLRKDWAEPANLLCAYVWLLPSRTRIFLMSYIEAAGVLGDKALESSSFKDNGYYTTFCTPRRQQAMERFEDHWDVFNS